MSRFDEHIPEPVVDCECACGCGEDLIAGEQIIEIDGDKIKDDREHFYNYAMNLLQPTHKVAGGS